VAKQFQGRSYNMMVAHTAIVFMRYAMLPLEARNFTDDRTLGDLFYYFCDEAEDIKFVASLFLILDLLRKVLDDNPVISEEVMHQILDSFISGLPLVWKEKLRLSA